MSRHFRECSECRRRKLAAGGVETRPGVWLCAACWVRQINRRQHVHD